MSSSRDPFPYYLKLLAQKKLDDRDRGKIGVEVTATELECMKDLIDKLMELHTMLDTAFDYLGSPVLQAFERLESVLFLRDTQD